MVGYVHALSREYVSAVSVSHHVTLEHIRGELCEVHVVKFHSEFSVKFVRVNTLGKTEFKHYVFADAIFLVYLHIIIESRCIGALLIAREYVDITLV